MTGRVRFSLWQLFALLTMAAILFGGVRQLLRAQQEVKREAVKQAYEAGNLSLEEARQFAGDAVDDWHQP